VDKFGNIKKLNNFQGIIQDSIYKNNKEF